MDHLNNEINNLIDWDAGFGSLRLENEQKYWNKIRAMVKQSLTDVNGNVTELSTVIYSVRVREMGSSSVL